MKKIQGIAFLSLLGISFLALVTGLILKPRSAEIRSRAAMQQGTPISFGFGVGTDVGVVGDWTGHGISSPSIVRNNGTTWIEKNTNATGYGDQTITLTLPSSVIQDGNRKYVACKLSGNSISSPGVYSNGVFYVRTSNTSGVPDLIIPFGQSGDTPICGDWTGQGVQTIGIVRNGVWYLRNTNTSGYADITFAFGLPTDLPIVGRWLGSTDLPGIFRNGMFYLKNSLGTGNADSNIAWGQVGDEPITGDWTGTGITGVGIFRSGGWLLLPLISSSMPTPSPIPPSGLSMPIGDYINPTTHQVWHQVFADDFNKTVPLGSFPSALPATWKAYPYPWKDYSGNGTYDPSRVISIQNGMMHLNLHTVNGEHLVAGPEPIILSAPPCAFNPSVVPYQPCGVLYGRFAVRFKVDPTLGFGTAWLLWANSGNMLQDGEIDFPEGNLEGNITANMHHINSTCAHCQDNFPASPYGSSWHTAVTEWMPNYIKFYLDNTLIGTSTSALPNTPMRWVLQTQTDCCGLPPAASSVSNVYIDWVSAYSAN